MISDARKREGALGVSKLAGINQAAPPAGARSDVVA